MQQLQESLKCSMQLESRRPPCPSSEGRTRVEVGRLSVWLPRSASGESCRRRDPIKTDRPWNKPARGDPPVARSMRQHISRRYSPDRYFCNQAQSSFPVFASDTRFGCSRCRPIWPPPRVFQLDAAHWHGSTQPCSERNLGKIKTPINCKVWNTVTAHSATPAS